MMSDDPYFDLIELAAKGEMTSAVANAIERHRAEKNEIIDQLIKERDLALTHDTQPYPTAEAYERVCATLHECEKEIERLTTEHAPQEHWHCPVCGRSVDAPVKKHERCVGCPSSEWATAEKIQALRRSSGCGLYECKSALLACRGDDDAAYDYLRTRGVS